MQVKMNSMIGSRGILYDELARAGSSQSCYICGADHATWTIYSKCMADNRPFFPFLEYHKPSKEVKKLGKGGRTLACNLCYSLLIQQWNAYEANGTPVLKRLYWLKRTSGGESGTIEGYGSDCSSPDKFSVRHDFSDSDDQGGTAGSESGRFSAHSIRGADSESVADTGDTKDLHFRARASPAGQDTEERMDRPGVVFVPDPYGKLDQGVPGECCCFVCGRMKAKEFMRSVHSRPQLKPETPFYPCLAQYRQPPNAKPMDFQGKVLVCEACQKFLFQQWQVFQRNGTPASERQYQLRSDPSFPKDQQSEFATMVCFLCRTIQPATSGRFIHSQKHTLGDPFYPFLKNLPLPPGAMPLTREGLTCACSSCRKSLYQQWKTFEAARIPDEDRVYANLMDKTIGSAFQPSINPLPPDHEILCFICQTRDYRQNMKELHASPYANMCLSFLEKIEKFPGTVYLRDSLQALVCKFCYHSIRDQWETFEAKHIPLDKRQYRLHSTVPVAYTKTSTLMAIMSTGDYEASHCDLCEVELPTTELQDLLIAPTCLAGKEKTVPYFPFLSRWKTYNEGENASSKKILVCKLCAANLVAQWNRYERMMDCSDNERWNRRYKVHHFICYRCGDTVHRTNVKVLDRRRYSSLLTQQPPRDAIELKNLVVICWECKEKLDTEGREMQILSKRDVARRSERHMVCFVFFFYYRFSLIDYCSCFG